MNFKERLLALEAKINGVTSRERSLLVLSGLALLYGVFELTFLKKYDANMGKLRGQVTQTNSEMANIETQIAEISAQYEFDPDAAEKSQKQQIEAALVALDKQLKDKMGGLISPANMVALLQGVLSKQKGLTLTNLKSLDPVPLIGAAKDEEPAKASESSATYKSATEKAGVGIFRHGLIIELEGEYLSSLSYLKSLEALPWQLYWDVLDYEVIKYPRARIRIQVHTISGDAKWIGV